MPLLKLFTPAVDLGLNTLNSDANKILICSALPTSYANAQSVALGYKSFGAGACFADPVDLTPGPGRKITSFAITNGTITANGVPSYWAVIDEANSRLLAAGDMLGGIQVISGSGFTLDAFTINVPSN
jgi:hypothetical protein